MSIALRCGLATTALVALLAVVISSGGFDARILLRAGWVTGLMAPVVNQFVDVHDDAPGFYTTRMFASDEHLRKVAQWQPLDGDVFVATFPKSGTHLMMQMVAQTLGEGQLVFDTIHHHVNFLDTENLQPERCNDSNLLNVDNYKKLKPNHPGVHVSHLPVSMIMRPDAAVKYIVVMRNPLDVLMSMYGQLGKLLGPGSPTLEEIYDTGFVSLSRGYAEYNLQWWQEHKRHPEKVLFLFYEDIVGNLTGTVTQVSKFLGRSPDSEEVERIKYKCSIQYMKTVGASFEPPECVLPIKGQHGMINKGQKGRGKALISPRLQEKVWKYYHSVFDGTDFPTERYSAAETAA